MAGWLDKNLLATVGRSIKQAKDLEEVKDVLSRWLLNPRIDRGLQLHLYSVVYAERAENEITGVGFLPQLAVLLAIDSSDGNINLSIGFDTGALHIHSMIHSDGTMVYGSSSHSARIYRDSGNEIGGYFTSFNADGGIFHTSLTGTCSMEVRMLLIG